MGSISAVAVVVIIVDVLFVVGQKNFSKFPCAPPHNRNPKIVGGLEADRHEMPFIVSLMRRGGHFCGATIINENWLLTAGHCVCNGLNTIMKPAHIQGVLGLHSISDFQNEADLQNEVSVEVGFKRVVPHPEYACMKVMNDIALLELSQPIKFGQHIQPACIAIDNRQLDHENMAATVSGWGWTNEDHSAGIRSDVLRKATVEIWNNELCEKSYQDNGKKNHFIADTQLCAGYKHGGIDSCWADSGGPLMTSDNTLVGVVSTGIGCARPGLPGIYTRASKYIKWMEDVTGTS